MRLAVPNGIEVAQPQPQQVHHLRAVRQADVRRDGHPPPQARLADAVQRGQQAVVEEPGAHVVRVPPTRRQLAPKLPKHQRPVQQRKGRQPTARLHGVGQRDGLLHRAHQPHQRPLHRLPRRRGVGVLQEELSIRRSQPRAAEHLSIRHPAVGKPAPADVDKSAPQRQMPVDVDMRPVRRHDAEVQQASTARQTPLPAPRRPPQAKTPASPEPPQRGRSKSRRLPSRSTASTASARRTRDAPRSAPATAASICAAVR